MSKRIAIVTGATRGMGWALSRELSRREFHVVLVGRDARRLEERRRELADAGGDASAVELDLGSPASVQRGAQELRGVVAGALHLLVNNAGIFPEREGAYDPELMRLVMQTNCLGPFELTMALREELWRGRANVVNVSSAMGGLKEMGPGYPAYRLSKTAMNAATRYLSQEWRGHGVRVNSVCPGWVRTEMGGASAERSVEQGVASILWAALLPEDGPSGGFFRDGQPLDW